MASIIDLASCAKLIISEFVFPKKEFFVIILLNAFNSYKIESLVFHLSWSLHTPQRLCAVVPCLISQWVFVSCFPSTVGVATFILENENHSTADARPLPHTAYDSTIK